MVNKRFFELQKSLAQKVQAPVIDSAFSRISASINSVEREGYDPVVVRQLREMEKELQGLLPELRAAQQRESERVAEDNGTLYPQTTTALWHLQQKVGEESVDPVKLSREGDGYRDSYEEPLPAPQLVKTNWLSRFLRKMVAWLEK